jgi:DNA-binding transcriptional LysR family regulator
MLLPDAREILELAASAQRRLAGTTGALRIGYVSWLPDDLPASAPLHLRVDEWVMPSHVQIGRVLDGGLDAAVAWAGAPDDRLDSVCSGPNRSSPSPVLGEPINLFRPARSASS